MRALHVGPIYPGNGVPPRPGEDRPGLSPFGRLAMGGCYGKSSILLYDHRADGVQQAGVDMIDLQGDDLDACQLTITLHPPRVIPLPFHGLQIDTQNITGEQSNSEVSNCDFPGECDPIRWPPLEALVEFGVGGVSAKVVVDYVNGVTFSVVASFLRVSALVTQSQNCGDICGTSAAYHLAAHVGPGACESRAQRTVFVGEVDDDGESRVFDIPRFGKTAMLLGRGNHNSPISTEGFIRFWQDPKGQCGVGDVRVTDRCQCIEVPNAAQYFSVYNESGHKMRMNVIFGLALR